MNCRRYGRAQHAATLVGGLLSLAAVAAFAQGSEDERSALEEAERQRNIARTFAANARQVKAYDLQGRELASIGEPELYTYVKYSPNLSLVATIRIDLQQELSNVWILDAETGEPTQLTHSQAREFVQTPVWSPDGSEIAYVALRGSRFGIYRQRPEGDSEPELVFEHGGGPISLGDWSADGKRLAFSVSDLSGGRLYALELEGDGEPIVILEAEHPVNTPRFSPDGRYLSYFSDESGRNEYYVIRALPQQNGVEPERWQITRDGAFGIGQWDKDDPKYYYLGAERRVMAVEVDTRGELELGTPQLLFTVPEAIPAGGGGGLVTLSESGDRVAMALPPVRDLVQVAVLDRQGEIVRRLGEPGQYFQPSFSPDGARVVTLRQDVESGTVDVWVLDADDGDATRITDTVNIAEDSPVWLHDGQHVAYSYFDDDRSQIYRKAADGTGEQQLLFAYTPGAFITLMDASADGEYIAFESFGYVVSVPLKGDDPLTREGIDLLREEYEVSSPRFSPDGHFVAYTYNDSGRPEVFVAPFDPATGTAAPGSRMQVSTNGAVGGVSWRDDGEELYYLSENLATEDELYDATLMAVAVSTSPELSVGPPQELFTLTVPPQGNPAQWRNARSDGEQFLFALPTE